MVPMLDQLLAGAGASGAQDAVIGMAHRGRLNVLAHIVGVSYEAILAEFEAGRGGSDALVPKGGLDDVKYHLGAHGTFTTPDGKAVRVTLSPNPSHLEAVNPVVEGHARAQQIGSQRRRGDGRPRSDDPDPDPRRRRLCRAGSRGRDLQHGAPAGLPNRRHPAPDRQQPGRLHHRAVRGTLDDYSSDLAKGFDAPIIHVNSDDAEACLAAARLAWMYREKFHGDVVIDLVGYRRYGHNEGDEPAYTQPRMYTAIAAQPSVREQYRSSLVEAGVVSAEEADGWATAFAKDLAARQGAVRGKHDEHASSTAARRRSPPRRRPSRPPPSRRRPCAR